MKEKFKKKLLEQIDQADLKLLKILYSTAKLYLSEDDSEKEEKLFRLVYISMRDPLCTDEDIQEILKVSQRNNKPNGVTGLLLHTDMRFLQILEGRQFQVKSAYQKIAKDSRHSDSKLLYFQPVSQRHFSDWHMGFKNIEDKELQFDTSISEEQRELYKAIINGGQGSYDDKSMKALKTFMILT